MCDFKNLIYINLNIKYVILFITNIIIYENDRYILY